MPVSGLSRHFLPSNHRSRQPQWKKPFKSEFDSLKRKVIKRVDMPAGAVPIKTKWGFKLKRNEHNVIVRYKDRVRLRAASRPGLR